MTEELILTQAATAPTWSCRRVVLDDRPVVVREILYDVPRRRAELARSVRDVRVLACLDHPRLAAWQGAVADEGSLRLTREWIEGESLARHGALGGGEPPLLALAADLLTLLVYVHEAGHVLRRLHPGNIILRSDGRPIVTDWGVRLPRADEVVVAPEITGGCEHDPRSDLYELGAVLHYAASGRVPGGDGIATAARERGECFAALLESLLARHPSERAGSARQALRHTGRELPTKHAARDPRSAHLLGRESEIETLSGAVCRLREDRVGGVVFIRGEAGLGKTRLLDEVGRIAAVSHVEVVPALAAYYSGLPFGALAGCFAKVAAAMSGWSAEQMAEVLQVDGRALLSVSSEFQVVEALRALPRLGRLAPDAARHRMMRVACRAIGAYTRQRPLVLLLDDLERADVLSIESLRYLVRTELHGDDVRGAPILIVASYAAEAAGGGRGSLRATVGGLRIKGQASELALRALAPHEVRDLVAVNIEPSLLPDGFVATMIEETGGNPFQVEETLRWAAAELGRRRPDRTGGWTSRWDQAKLLKAGVEDEAAALLFGGIEDRPEQPSPVNARLGELGSEARGLLDALALAGEDFPLRALRALAGAEIVERGLIECLRDGVLVEGDPERFRIRHPLHQVAIEKQIGAGRRLLHDRIGSAIEGLVGQLDEHAPLALAHHFHEAGDVERSLLYLPMAARLLKERHAPVRAMQMFERFFQHLQSLDEVAQARHRGRRLQVLQAMAETFDRLGRTDEALRTWREMAAVAEGESERDLVTAWTGIARLSLDSGADHDAETFATRAVAMAEQRNLELPLADNRCVLAAVACVRGDEAVAVEELERALAVYRAAGESHSEARALELRGDVYAARFEHDAAAHAYREALDRFSQHGDRLAVAAVHRKIGEMDLAVGDGTGALEHHREALAIVREADHREGICDTLEHLGEVHRARGELDQARDAFQQALQLKRELADLKGSAETQLRLAEVEIADRKTEDARQLLEQTLALGRRSGNRSAEAGALLLLAQLAADHADAAAALPLLEDALQAARAAGDRETECRALIAQSAMVAGDAAVEKARESVLLCEALGHRGLQMRAYVRLGESLRAAGAEDEALRHYERALDEACQLLSAARTARGSLLRRGDVMRSLQDAGEFVGSRTDQDPAERFPVLKLAGE